MPVPEANLAPAETVEYSTPAVTSDPFAKWLLYSFIIGGTFLQKFALPLGSHDEIFLVFPFMPILCFFGLLSRRLEATGIRFALFCLMAGGMTLTQWIGPGNNNSLPSLMLMVLIHFPYIFRLKSGVVEPGVELRFFQKIMVGLAILGIFQYSVQFLIGSKYAFFLDIDMPQQFIIHNYNRLNALHYGGTTYKSNGVFLLEASLLCQFLAISIVIEMIYFKRAKLILLYCAGILVTFSGTGLIILGVLTPIYLIQHRQFLLLAVIVALLTLIVIFAPFLGLDDYVNRVGEFSSTRTSGFARFISIFYLLHEFMLPHADTLLLGMGAGSIKTVGGLVSYTIHDPTWGKIVFEYGVIGTCCYIPLMAYALFSAKRTPYLKTALAIQYTILGGYVLIPPVHCLILALLAWHHTPDLESAKSLPAQNVSS